MSDLLQEIQRLQFSDRSQAEALLLSFVRDRFPLNVTALQLRPQAISLNSFNGFLTLADGKRLFFKTHTEEDTVVDEYYNAALLADAGYPIIQPLHSSTAAGQQLLIYEVIDDPPVFDLAWSIETGTAERDDLLRLRKAQVEADKQLLRHYLETLEIQPAAEAGKAPIHQLFYHRLTGGRLNRFYGSFGETNEKSVVLPDGKFSMSEITRVHWTINGAEYDQTLQEIVETSTQLLVPHKQQVSIIGHGDAHNGNVFLRNDGTLLYFDPAFAGRHHPLLDLTKPLFHNVFAMWMYYPNEKREVLSFELTRTGDQWYVNYEYELHPIREMFLQSKVQHVLIPILRELRRSKSLRSDWRQYLKCALFCCPFLTMNLTDTAKFPPAITLLGLAMSIEMGAESYGTKSRIDQVLDEVEQSL